MTVPPDATEEEMAYNEKWRYVIQLRSVHAHTVSSTEHCTVASGTACVLVVASIL